MTATSHGTVGSAPAEDSSFPVLFTVKGRVGDRAREHASRTLAHLGRLGLVIERGRVVLTRTEAPTGKSPALAEATLEVLDRRRHRHTVHAEVRAGGMIEAIDLLEQKLRNGIVHLDRDPHRDH